MTIPESTWNNAKQWLNNTRGTIAHRYQIGDELDVAVSSESDIDLHVGMPDVSVDGLPASEIPGIAERDAVIVSLTPENAFLLGKALLAAAKKCGVSE
ncbi:hypothetical protein ACOTJD_28210 [Achromobacter xylosoxidans]